MNAVTELLIATRERILEERKWCPDELAEDYNGMKCSVNSPRATKWSLSGALLLEGLGIFEERKAAAELIREVIGTHGIMYWNATHYHYDVINALTSAIEIAAEREAVAV